MNSLSNSIPWLFCDPYQSEPSHPMVMRYKKCAHSCYMEGLLYIIIIHVGGAIEGGGCGGQVTAGGKASSQLNYYYY